MDWVSKSAKLKELIREFNDKSTMVIYWDSGHTNQLYQKQYVGTDILIFKANTVDAQIHFMYGMLTYLVLLGDN
jgi:hypothetical protein